MRSYGIRIIALSSAVFLYGCQAMTVKQDTADFETHYSKGDFTVASETALKAGNIEPDGASKSLYWSLQAGASLAAQGKYELSNKVFDGAEKLMKVEDTEHLGKKGLEKATAVLLNNTFNDYSPAVYDGVMVNTYKATNFMLQNDLSGSRVEFNRASDRQRRAAEHFKEKIKRQDEQLAEEQKKREKAVSAKEPNTQAIQPMDYDKSVSESEKTIYEAYPELENWKAYPDFVNPYTNYLHGLFFMLGSQQQSDFGKARESIRSVAGMVPRNKAVKTDLKVINNLRKGTWRKSKLKPAVWVIFENGQAPIVEENIIPLPLFLVSDKVEYMQIALPKLTEREKAFPHLNIYNGKKKLAKTEHLASMDRVVQTEFKKEFPYKVTEAIASTMTKAFIQYQARKEGGLIGSLASAVYQAATTKADTRSWSSLPKEIQIARIRKPSNGKIEIMAPQMEAPISIDLPDNQFSVVFVKTPTKQSKLTHNVIGFDA